MSSIVDKILTEKGPSAAPAQPAAAEQDMSTTADIAKSLGSGVARGVVGLPGVFGDIETLGRMGLRAAGAGVSADPFMPTSREVISGVAGVLPEAMQPALTYQPQTAAGRMARTAGEFGGGAIIPVGGFAGATGRQLLKTTAKGAGAMTGIGAATGGVEEVAGPGPALLFSIPATLGYGALSSIRGPMSQIVKETMPSRMDVEGARQLQRTSQEMGVPLLGPEAMTSPRLRQLAGDVAATPEGGAIIQEAVRQRAQAVPGLLGQSAEAVGPQATTPLGLSRQASEAAEKSLLAAEKTRTTAVTPLYNAAKSQSVPGDSIKAILEAANEAKKTVARGGPTERAIDTFISRISSPSRQKGKRNPVTNVGRLDSAFKEFRDKLNLPAGSQDAMLKEAKGVVGNLNNQLDNVLKDVPELAAARGAYQQITDNVVNVLGDSGLKALSAAKTTPQKVVDIIASPEMASPQSIARLSSALNKQDATVFPKIARQWLDNAADQAQKITVGAGEAPISMGAKFAQTVRGTPAARSNLNAILNGVAQAQGKTADETAALVTGFNRMLDVLERTATIPGVGSPTAQRAALREAARQRTAADILDVRKISLLGAIPERMREAAMMSRYKNIAEAMTRPDSVDALINLAKVEVNSTRARNIVNSLIAVPREIESALGD